MSLISIILTIAIVVVPAVVIFEYAMRLLKKAARTTKLGKVIRSDKEKSAVKRTVNTLRIVFYAFLAVFALGISGINVTAYLAGAGFLGIVIGLAVQAPLSNYFSGLYIVLSRMVSVGDVIGINAVGSNISTKGKITYIGFTHTHIIADDGTDQLVPNNVMISSIVTMIKSTHQIKVEKESDAKPSVGK